MTRYELNEACENWRPKKKDPVNPDHYRTGGIECIDALRSVMSPEEFEGFCRGNAIKYLWRCREKGGIEDVKKAIWYLRMMVGEEPR